MKFESFKFSILCFFFIVGCGNPESNQRREYGKQKRDTKATPTESLKSEVVEKGSFGTGPGKDSGLTTISDNKSLELGTKVKNLLTQYCTKCHGFQQTAGGGLTEIDNLERMIETKYIVPGSPSESILLQRIDMNMPPVGNPQLNAAQKKDITDWIAQGAKIPSSDSSKNRQKVAFSNIYDLANRELKALSQLEKRKMRFVFLTGQHNAGKNTEVLKDLRQGTIKLLNGVSKESELFLPKIISGSEETLLMVSLEKLGWNVEAWQLLTADYPYLVPDNELGNLRELQEQTGSIIPIIRADWFIANASKAPLYYQLLGTPLTQAAFYADPRIDVDMESLIESTLRSPSRVIRSGFNGSQVAEFSRVLERVDSAAGFLWQSYEFGSDSATKNPFAKPFGPRVFQAKRLEVEERSDPRFTKRFFEKEEGSGQISTEKEQLLVNAFSHDGNEIIYTLPNGMLAFAVFEADGSRRDTAPSGTLDKVSTQNEVTVGTSCMSCHFKGFIDKKDQVRESVQKSGLFSDNTFLQDMLKNLYVEPEVFTTQINSDSATYQSKLTSIGVEFDRLDPIFRVFNAFERHPLDALEAASEADLTVEELRNKILSLDENSKASLSPLLSESGKVSRNLFETEFRKLFGSGEKQDISEDLLNKREGQSRGIGRVKEI